MRLRHSLLLFPFFLFAAPCAHSGFNRLVWQEGAGPYTITVLEDFHVSAAEAQLFVQLSKGKEAVPEGTSVGLELSQQGNLIYAGEVPFAANSSSDGKTYTGYLLSLPLSEEGFYDLNLQVTGPLGSLTRSYGVVTQRGGVSAAEYLPSILILMISLGGAALLFVPIKRKDDHETPDKSRQDVPIAEPKPRA